TYTLKTFSHSRGFVKAVFDGYEVSGITRLQSGPYLTVTGQGPGAANSALGNRRADCLSSEQLIPNGERGPNNWVDRTAFAAAPDTRRGTSGVGTLLGPGAQTWHFSLRRRFGLTEKFKLQFQADIFNAFNRANFRDLETNLNNGGFAQVSTTSPPRNIQFGLKLTF
ncbi:MAG TPA: hypothetical protein VM656_09645, partial [Pyrinomonadaceae bacterium]|nr:hypothetical protein [Pyrinomonadaceae bacterium]